MCFKSKIISKLKVLKNHTVFFMKIKGGTGSYLLIHRKIIFVILPDFFAPPTVPLWHRHVTQITGQRSTEATGIERKAGPFLQHCCKFFVIPVTWAKTPGSCLTPPLFSHTTFKPSAVPLVLPSNYLSRTWPLLTTSIALCHSSPGPSLLDCPLPC